MVPMSAGCRLRTLSQATCAWPALMSSLTSLAISAAVSSEIALWLEGAIPGTGSCSGIVSTSIYACGDRNTVQGVPILTGSRTTSAVRRIRWRPDQVLRLRRPALRR